MQKLNHSRGTGLFLVILLISVVLVISGVTVRMIFSGQKQAALALEETQAFYLAEAAIELGKVKLAATAGWFTDIEHPENKEWLISEAAGFVGEMGKGKYKVVRIKDKNILYGIGFLNNSRCVLKVEYSLPIKSESFIKL
ncbi:MAG: hypothetical protein ABIJ26_02445 [Candidatus Margulisiibacteriota bacterium]|nr:hypothetical protein [Candidatus Margulisiibacteriota bacterium]